MQRDIPDTPDYRPTPPAITMQVYGHGTYMVDADLDGLHQFAAFLDTVKVDAYDSAKSVGSIEWNLPLSGNALSPGTFLNCTQAVGHTAFELSKVGFKAQLLGSLTHATAQTYASAETQADDHIRKVRAEFDLAMVTFGLEQACDPQNHPSNISSVVAATGPEVVKWAIQAITDKNGGHYTETMQGIDSKVGQLFPDHGRIVTTLAAHPGSSEAKAATGIADGAQRIDRLYDNHENAAHIQVQRTVDPVTHKNCWLILLPGTSPWTFNAKNPLDLGGNITNAAGRASAIERAAWDALDDAKRRVGDTDDSSPVMIQGHSQGGMAATNMAIHAKQTGRANVVAVATFGSPVGVQKVPAGVNTMNVRQHEDSVPDLAGLESGDHDPNRTVVILNDPHSLIKGNGKAGRGQAHDIAQYGRDYAIAAKNESADSSVTKFENDTRKFYSPKAETYIYDTTRVTPPKPVAPPEKHPGLSNRDPKDVR